MYSREFTGKVLGKTEEVKGLIFKSKVYKIAVLLNNEISTTREVPFHQYCLLENGKEYLFTMYSCDGETWYFSEREAYLTIWS